MHDPQSILKFWLDDVGPKQWYNPGETLDDDIRKEFEPTWNAAMEGKFGLWLTYPSGALAYIILLDQFPRNMFRGTAKAFASDRIALAAAKKAIHQGWDLKIDEPARQFFYMPLRHSECLTDQDRSVRLVCERMPVGLEAELLHARAHREVIRQFGRFPYRNQALRRQDTPKERAFLEAGGYGAAVQAVQQAA